MVVLLANVEGRRGLLIAEFVSSLFCEIIDLGYLAHLDSVPVLAGKGVLGLLLEALLTLRQSLVPGNRLATDNLQSSRSTS